MEEKKLEKIIYHYLESPFSTLEELELLGEFVQLSLDHKFNLSINSYALQDYIIKSDTLNYVYDFLASLNENYALELEQALKTEKIVFIQNQKQKKIENTNQYIVFASYELKDSFDLLNQFFDYWIHKNGLVSKDSFLVDTFSILAEFLFQDYLESLGTKNKELYYPKMNRFIHTNIFTLHMMVELKLIKMYQEQLSLEHLDTLLSEPNSQIIIQDILSMNSISLPFHKRYLYGLIFACFIHKKILKHPKLIRNFCYLIDHPKNITITEFMKAIGIEIDQMGRISESGYRQLRESYLLELEDIFIRINMEYEKSR